MLSKPALVRESEHKTNPDFVLMARQYVICILGEQLLGFTNNTGYGETLSRVPELGKRKKF
jgi:hypothetical protein